MLAGLPKLLAATVRFGIRARRNGVRLRCSKRWSISTPSPQRRPSRRSRSRFVYPPSTPEQAPYLVD